MTPITITITMNIVIFTIITIVIIINSYPLPLAMFMLRSTTTISIAMARNMGVPVLIKKCPPYQGITSCIWNSRQAIPATRNDKHDASSVGHSCVWLCRLGGKHRQAGIASCTVLP